MTLVPPSSKYGNATIVLGAKATGWTVNTGNAEVQLASVAIPANTIGLGVLEIITLWSFTNSVNTKTLRVRLGTANDLTGTQFLQANQTTTVAVRSLLGIANRTTSSQVSFNLNSNSGVGSNAAANTTGAVDTTQQTFVVFSGQPANAGESITLESYIVRLVPAV